MHRRLGMESMMGSQRVSQDSIRNLNIAEDLCQKGRPYEAVPYLQKAMEDPRNLDAAIQAAFLAPNFDEAVDLLLSAEKIGRIFLKRDLGSKCFDDDGDCVGRFWGLLETRPYMRVLQALVRMHTENKQYSKAADVNLEMLRLSPGDNLGQRYWTGALLAIAGRYEQALSYSQEWIEESSAQPDGKRVPSNTPLTPQKVAKLCNFHKADILYSAALAAFRFWGDCELARQYLYIGARLNPQILLKILAKVDRPKSLVMTARSMNGTEDAHDYLWLAQDAWMEKDVWDWANSHADAKASIMKTCSRKGCENKETKVGQYKRCSSCHQVWYCSTDCQRADWKTHKPKCKEHAELKKYMKSIARGKPAVPAPVHATAADFTADGIATTHF